MAKQLFRKVALERLSSPEQLDQLIKVTTPLGWLSVIAIGGLLVTAIFWGIYGSISTKVQGQGIILKKEGMVNIQAQASGKLIKVNVEVGDIVEKGQVIARLQQDELLERIRKAQLDLENLETSFGEKKKADEEAKRIQLQELKQREINQQQQIKNLEIQVEAQHALKQQREKHKEGLESLAKDGIIPRNKVLEVENEIIQIQQNINTLHLDIEKTRNQLNSILLEIKKIKHTETIDELTYTQQIEQAELKIRELQNTFAENSQVISPYKGRVTELPKKEEDLVTPETTIALMEKIADATGLEVVVYFSPLTGKQIQKDMSVQISPSIVKREEFGFMKGVVSEVDKYPSTFATIMKTLQNQALAQMLVANAAPIKVTVNLIPDADTISGYQWSSRDGPPLEIHSGTICFAEVTVKEQAPITLVIPILKRYLLGIESPFEKAGA